MKSNSILKKVFVLAAFLSLGQVANCQQVPEQELKKNVVPVKNALSYIQQLEPKKFEYNTSKFTQLKLPAGQQYGFLTENMLKVLPELVDSRSQSYQVGKNAYKSATYQHHDLESLIPILVGAIQEQQQQIDQLKRQLAEK